MMNYRYFDWKLIGGGANGLDYFQSFVNLIVNNMDHTSEVPVCPHIENITFFVHATGEQQGRTRDNWKEIAAIKKKRFVIFVSSHPEEFNDFHDSDDVYWLRTPLNLVVTLLTNHPDRLARFKQSCENGRPDLACFYLSFPENLVAAYLLGLAFNKISSLRGENFPDELWNLANQEYYEHSKQGELRLDRDNISDHLEAIKNILTKFKQYSTC